MGASLVEDIKLGGKDFNGNEITMVYGGVSELYAVYRAGSHVFIQFADDNTEGANQRAALCPIASLRSEVDTRIDRLRTRTFLWPCEALNKRAMKQANRKADEHERALARFLLMALQGQPEDAYTQLVGLRDEMNEDRASEVRTWHLCYAALTTAAILLVCCLLSSYSVFFGTNSPQYWSAAGIGSIGAFFSIALQIRGRAMPVDLQMLDNMSDAILRIFIGSTSAVMLYALIIGGVVGVQIGEAPLAVAETPDAQLAWRVVLAFTAGFTERLVSEFISGFSLVGKGASSSAKASIAGSAAKNELDIAAGRAAPVGVTPLSRPANKLLLEIPHDPEVPNRIEADELENAEELIGGKLDPMQEQR